MADEPITVTPLAETAEPVEVEQTAPSPQPEAQAPEVESPTAEPVEGDSQDDPPPEAAKADPPKPEKSHREKLIDQLTGVEEPKPEDTDEEADPPAPQDKAPETKPEGTPKDKPADEPLPEDLNELTNDTAKALKPGEVRRKINRLIKRVKEAEPFAKGYKEIVDTCAANGFAPDDYRAWVNIGIGVQQGDPRAVEALKQITQKAGIVPEAAPAAPTIPEDWLATQVKDLEISATAAAEIRKLQAKPAATPAPAPATAPRAAPVTAAPTTQAPRIDPVRQKADQDLDKVAQEYEAKLGKARFAELEPRILAGLKARKGAHPAAWGDIMRSVIEVELAKLPKAAPIQSGLRPGGKPGSSSPQFKTERERTIHRLTNG